MHIASATTRNSRAAATPRIAAAIIRWRRVRFIAAHFARSADCGSATKPLPVDGRAVETRLRRRVHQARYGARERASPPPALTELESAGGWSGLWFIVSLNREEA